MHTPLRLIRYLTSALLAALTIWVGASFALMLRPSAVQDGPDQTPVSAFLISNGVHVDIVVPLQSEDINWRDVFAADAFPQPPHGRALLAIGWGDRDFYLHTPHWRDVRPQRVLAALSGRNSTLLHVSWLPADARLPGWRLPLTRSQYQRLGRYIRDSLRLDPKGRAVALAGRHYGRRDAFFEAHGSYGALTTCNTWVGRGLRAAGVSTSAWTPLAYNLTAPLQPVAALTTPGSAADG